MATYISLVNFTDQGIRNVKQTVERAETFKQMATKMGVTVRGLYWTIGAHDVVVIADGPDEETLAAAFLAVGIQGNVRSETMRAFSADQMKSILAKLP
jgi:uncharacterized protein with GYD domain